ncbi:putative vacuolar protein sorting-associated protein [Plasmopara halstedii]
MGQQISSPAAVIQPLGERAKLRPLKAPYVPLSDVLRTGDLNVTEDPKCTIEMILEFGTALCSLPKESNAAGSSSPSSPEQQLKELMSPVDSVDELFHHISQLAGLPIQDTQDSAHLSAKQDVSESIPGIFDVRVASYVKHLQTLYQLTKKEKYRYEQSIAAVRIQALELRKVSPPPLPLPTQSAMSMGWDLAIMLLKATHRKNPEQYEKALQMVRENLIPLKPTAYSDSMYLAQSAASAFNMLSDCLKALAESETDQSLEAGAFLGARTIETLAEVGLARGSLATMLFVVLWLMRQPPTSSINLDSSLCKLAALKEQPMYGKCEALGELYSCGQNSYGELGTGDDLERHQLTSVALCGWDDIRQVVSGNEILAVLTNDGVVLTCGLNKSGQCGQGHSDERVMMLRPVQSLRSQRVKFIAASNGCEHMIALTESGLTYSWGYNDRGQLGHENLTTKLHVPKLIESLKDKKVKYAAVSYHHSAVITDSGELFMFGMNDCGQLGLDHTQHQSTPQLVTSLVGTEILMVACGLYHTIICTVAGALYTCGKNDYGQLGLGHNRLTKVATVVNSPNDLVCFVACGYYHSVAVTTSGRALSFGRNDYGQLGIGNKIHQNTLNVVALSANTKMVQATCGCYHTVLLSEQGQVFVFGRNNKGQLGNRGNADALLPVPLKVRPEKNPRRCIDVAAGFYTTSLVVERKRENDDGDLMVLDTSCVICLCGRVDIDRSGEIEGLSNFGSISTVGVSLFDGKWFYEVEVVTSGLIQIGWIDGYFEGSSDQGEGVGDHAHSWSYDGNRQRRWNSGSFSYGEKWRAGDIVGCLLDLTTQEMTFFRNGVNLGVAYSVVHCSREDPRSGLMPGISLERGEIIRVNLGHQPFAFPPTISRNFESISSAVMMPSGSAVLQSPKGQLSENVFPQPPHLKGYASVLIGEKLFVIGGIIVNDLSVPSSSEPTNQVWMYDTAAKSWEMWADFPIGICHHQVVAVNETEMLVLGGEKNCAASRHMDLYRCSTLRHADGSLPSWTLVQASIGAATSMPPVRAFHTASTIQVRMDTVVFMYGGKSIENEILGDVWYLSIEDYTWSKLPSSVSLDPGPRIGCSSAVIGECVYIFGGQDREGKFRSDLWRYNTFDRLWLLCHDDHSATSSDVAGTLTNTTRKSSQLVLPEGRVRYSMCSDLGNIWIFGGINVANTLLCDLWYFSVTSQKWNHVEMDSRGDFDGCCSAALYVQVGTATALPNLKSFEPLGFQNGEMFLVGGRIYSHGQVFDCIKVRKLYSGSITGSFCKDMTKTRSMSEKALHVLNALRTNCEVGTRSSQQCAAESLASAVCLLSHLDRLAGNDIPAEDKESVQLSRCLYRSLCIDPNETSFAALYALLDNLTSRFFAFDLPNAKFDMTQLVSHVLYPLLVTLRLLKFNLFEFSRSCLDSSEIGLSASASESGGILCLIREQLFKLIDHALDSPEAGEVLWFYQAIKQESALAIYHGFSTLYPSLLERLQIMNHLMVNKKRCEKKLISTQKLLLPMLVPYFTSANMLFQLMRDPDELFGIKKSANEAVSNSVITFLSTLIDAMCVRTIDAMEQSAEDITKLLKSIDAIESSDEFMCLNVMLRAAIYWCSCSTSRGWMIIEAVCAKLVGFVSDYLDKYAGTTLDQNQNVAVVIQHTFAVKLLPFIMLSVLSLPSVREALPDLLETIWPQLEMLSVKLHAILQVFYKHKLSDAANYTGAILSDQNVDFETTAPVSVSKELSDCLGHQSTKMVDTYGEIFTAMWSKITSIEFTNCKIQDLSEELELRRVTIPVDLATILGIDSILVRVRKTDGEFTSEYNPRNISFAPSRTVLSQHLFPVNEKVLTDFYSRTKTSLAFSTVKNSIPTDHFVDKILQESYEWLHDLQNVFAWIGSLYAATLIVGGESDHGSVRERWLNSPLFRGGLEEPGPETHNANGRNEAFLLQVIDNVGNGKKLLDKVRNALDSGAGKTNTNPQLRAVRLKRQDSVEATLEKSGGIEAVDRAVRATFAALLKHTNISYTTEPISDQGTLAETVVDAWKASLQLRRCEAGASSGLFSEIETKDRQQALYNAVCEPIIRRALLLLQLSAVPIQSTSPASSPLKLLPGISMTTNYDYAKISKSEPAETIGEVQEQKHYTRQLNKLMKNKSVEMMEEEDEQIHSDILSFIQQSGKNLVISSRESENPSRHSEDQMRDILLAHQNRAISRLQGLQTFVRVVQSIENLPGSRLHVIPMLSLAFKRIHTTSELTNNVLAGHASTIKVHYLADLEFAGPRLSDLITREFFHLLSLLLESSMDNLRQIQRLFDAKKTNEVGVTTSSSAMRLAVHDMLLVLETCCFPFRGQDWDQLQRTNLVPLLTELTSWKGWQRIMQYEVPNASAGADSLEKFTILPATTGSSYPNIICSRYITLGTDLRKLVVAHKTLDASSEILQNSRWSLLNGGLAVFDKCFLRGRWYWEMSNCTIGDTPIFVGVTDGTVDLNRYRPEDKRLCGVFLYNERCNTNMIGPMGLQWHRADTLGVLLNCERRQIEFYREAKRCLVVNLSSAKLTGYALFLSLGLENASIFWNLGAAVPPQIWWASFGDFSRPPITSGGLIAVPLSGTTMGWDRRRKGDHLDLLPCGTTAAAVDCSSSEDIFETIVASHGFENECIYAEVQIVSAGRNGRSALSFGFVSTDFVNMKAPLQHKVDLTFTNIEEVLQLGIFGILFDFRTVSLTVYSERAEPELYCFDLAPSCRPLFPAVSALCNGTIFDVNFHPPSRLELPISVFQPVLKHQNPSVNEQQLGRSLQLQVYSCDGGEFSSSHSVLNCLVDDTTVYSSTEERNVNLVLKHEIDTPMCVAFVTIRGPGQGYSSPLQYAAIFVTSTPPDLTYFSKMDDLSPEQFSALPFPPSNGCCSRDETLPVAFIILENNYTQVSKRLAFPVTGRYILVKAIRPLAGTNIDIGYVGFSGIFEMENGLAYSETSTRSCYSCDECKRVASDMYHGKSCDACSKLCFACYDDNRGDLDSEFYLYTLSDSQSDTKESSKLLCPPRRAWSNKIAALSDVTIKPSVCNTVTDGNAGQIGQTEKLQNSANFEDCELFSCGQNNYGELCLGHCNLTSKLEHVPYFSSKSIRCIAGGNEVLAVVMNDGTIFTCGLNKSGQCGNGTFEERVVIATPVRALSGILVTMVAAANGCEHMLAVASDGAVYSWGYNDRGQLGLGSTISKSHTPRVLESLQEKYHITTAAVSYHHSAVVSSNGELLMFGMNDCGQLGLDHTQHQTTPQLVNSLSGRVVTKVACGLYHTIASTRGGEVYSFGKNDYGQLGLGHSRNVKVPTLVKTSFGGSEEKVVDVNCGYYHTVTVNEKGKLVTWGRNDYGQLGIGSKDHKNTAQVVPLPLSSKIKSASCGCYHTLILMSNGRVMVFGRNNKGQLGTGPRTLPSAELPLPIPSNSLANDEVVQIAAGFYSSYLLTGRSDDSHRLDGTYDEANQAKDLPENSCIENSDALFESLMKEIDGKIGAGTQITRAPLHLKRSISLPKLPFIKLYTAGWAMIRALMYRSLQNVDDKTTNRVTGPVNPVLKTFIIFLLENLTLLQGHAVHANSDAIVTAQPFEFSGTVSLKRVCVSLLQYFGSKVEMPLSKGVKLDALHGHFYKNQVLSVLLACGSANANIGSTIAVNTVVTVHIIRGMSSIDYASAMLCIRLAMLVFPHHSVSSLNKIYRSQRLIPDSFKDIITMLMTLVGLPMLLRPRLCSHELGLECASTLLCQSARCLKGATVATDTGCAHIQHIVLEKMHVREAKAAEIVALLRYLTRFPAWKIAINAAICREFARTTKIDELLDTICSYYTNVQHVNIAPLTDALNDGNGTSLSRKPESTTLSPETDESKNNLIETVLETTNRDKHSLMLWQKAKDALDGLATIVAAICVVGGNVEEFREGAYVSIDDQASGKLGVLSGVVRESRTAELLMKTVVISKTDKTWSPLVPSDTRSQLFSLSKLQVVERIPVLIDMLNDVEGIIVALSSLLVKQSAPNEFTRHCNLDLPQNSPVQEVLWNRLNMCKQQIRWRSAKALASLLKQLPSINSTLLSVDSQLISNLAELLASENSLSWLTKSDISGLDTATVLQKRWSCVKQRQAFLNSEEIVDAALDQYEAPMREEVVEKLRGENALGWGTDALQSPRRKVGPTSPGLDVSRQRLEHNANDLPFGTWGVLLPLPQLNENESTVTALGPSAVNFSPFPLTAPIVRVGRAADACDLVVNDRSVSGRHFHLRRLRHETDGGEAQYELQDFSKNGTIVNGVRIHGSTTRIQTGSRISLIMSRGGLMTYEFQVRTVSGGRQAPSSVVTALQNSGDLNILIPGQEYQNPQTSTPLFEPRSPAELQNRGARGTLASSESLLVGRSREAATQNLRVITTVAERDVPRAILSPNPAVDSPRTGGFSSPRSSLLQPPGTPVVRPLSSGIFSSIIPSGILSPASYQQRESSATNVSTGVPSLLSPEGGVASMLRVVLGRDSVNRESPQRAGGSISSETVKTRVQRPSGFASLTTRSNGTSSSQELQALALHLRARTQKENLVVSAADCEEALRLASGNMEEALRRLLQSRKINSPAYSSDVRHLATLLGRSEESCAEALHQTTNNVSDALRLLLSDSNTKLETPWRSSRHHDAHSVEPCVDLKEIGDENPSYALAEFSAQHSPKSYRLVAKENRFSARNKKTEHSSSEKLQPRSDLALWSECNSSFDEDVRRMNSLEVEIEEKVLCERLAAIHARKVLLQIVRLSQNASPTHDVSLGELSDPLVLRPLISILNAPDQPTANFSYEHEYPLQQQPKVQKSGKIQQILSRMVHEMMSRSSSETLSNNLRLTLNISTIQRSIDQITEQPTRIGWTGVTRLMESLVDSDYSSEISFGDDGNVPNSFNTLDEMTFETILHILSRTHTDLTAPHCWESFTPRAQKRDRRFPKGPLQLSCGLQVVVVDTYERVWSIPPCDPLLKHRHKWRKRLVTSTSCENAWMKSAADFTVTIWRPIMPPALDKGTKWYSFGDVAKSGTGAPNAPMLLVCDTHTDDLLAPPVSFERVDVTGKGLPRNSDCDSDFQRKQLRSIWWPVAPSGYVAIGCVAGSKEDPFEPPDVSCIRCVREDLVKRVQSFHCVWRATSPASVGGGGVERPATEAKTGDGNGGSGWGPRRRSTKNQSTDTSRLIPVTDDVIVKTSLWAIDSDLSFGILLPVVTLSDTSANELHTAFALKLTDDDRVLCSPISVENVLANLEVLLQYQQFVNAKLQDSSKTLTQLRPELPAALFALIRQVLSENQPSSGKTAVSLVRALVVMVQRGAYWYDKPSLLYCRSKILAFIQEQDGSFTLHGLLQAFVELMLAVEDQQHSQRVQELAACMECDTGTSLSLPYSFHFAKPSFGEIVVSHSSKMAVTRHLSGDERKFVLENHLVYESNTAALAVEKQTTIPVEVSSCRFEHTPALLMTMRDKVKAEIVYFEVTVLEWSATTSPGSSLALGFSSASFPLEGVQVGGDADSARSYSFLPATGQVLCASDSAVDRWRWNEPVGAVIPGDIFGCGLRIDTQELFFCKNGQLLGTAFSSISRPQQLHPTISMNADCKLLANLGATSSTPANHVKFTFRFYTLDCDNLMTAFEWFEPLSQVYGVMKALMDPARPDEVGSCGECDKELRDQTATAQLPDEFILSADNFLSEISEDVCICVQSAHPYDSELQESVVSIPLATSIRVRLDPRSETASSHCLQILQGGTAEGGPDRATAGEAEVRAFTGACGGQEVRIEGDSFVWRFPVQSNFQCRVDRVRKGPYLKLEVRDTRMSLVRDKGWQTAIGMARFDGGIHIWEVRIVFVTTSSNIFLGIARRDVRLDSYLGKDNRGWGWIGNRALWHNGSKQRGTYGDKFNTGDIVRITLDLRRGTLSYALNGRDLGVAFGPGGTGPKLEGTFFPAFALYNQRDSIELIGGHRVEDGGLEPELLRTSSGLASGDDSYYSDDDDLGGLMGSSEGAEDGSIPNFRMDLAIALSQMGFPIEWCLYALRQCDDDAEQAADYILANIHSIDALVREENEVMARRTRHRQLLQEQALALSGEAYDVSVAPSTEEDVTAARPAEEVSSIVDVSTVLQPSSGDMKWGIAFTAVPEFSVTGRRLLASKYRLKLLRLHESQRIFTAARDRALVQLVNEICESRAEALLSCDPLRMAPEEFVPTEEQIRAYSVLREIPLEALQRRFLLLRNFNCRLQTSLAFIDFSAQHERSLLARGVRELRGIIFQHVKLAWWLGILKEQQAPAAARPEIEVDRNRAHDALELSERGHVLASEAGERDSVFAQTFEQLHNLQPALLRGADRAFKCQFVGEFGDDFGGLYRECLAQLSSELQTFTPLLPLLRPCPNALMSTGENRELFVPNSHLRTSARHVQMAEFLGKLAGVAVRTKTPLDLNLAPAVWKLLVGQQVTRHDIEAIHHGCFQVVDTIANLDAHGITEPMFDEIVDASFTVLSSTRETVELVPGGKHLHVTWDDREDYAHAVEMYRLAEFTPVCRDILRGMATILPASTLSILSWHELRTLVCGKASVDIALLRRRTVYGDGCHATDPHITYFWDVLAKFSEEQKSSFLRFVWGRSRLPTHAADFTQDFKIAGLPRAVGRADMYLPIAHTCFFSIDLPAYSCKEVMHDKLVYAITHCQSIDADNTTVAQRAGQGINWTNAPATVTAAAATAVSSVIAGIDNLGGE